MTLRYASTEHRLAGAGLAETSVAKLRRTRVAGDMGWDTGG